MREPRWPGHVTGGPRPGQLAHRDYSRDISGFNVRFPAMSGT